MSLHPSLILSINDGSLVYDCEHCSVNVRNRRHGNFQKIFRPDGRIWGQLPSPFSLIYQQKLFKMKSVNLYTIERCPKCCSNDLGVQETTMFKQYYRVQDGGVEILPFIKNKTLLNYKFKCKECGHEWESEIFPLYQN